MATVTYKGASRIYPKAKGKAVNELDLDIRDGEFIVLVGPSGCGKTTSLRMLAGLEPVDEGEIFIDERSVARLAPRDRDIAMVFQNYALYPHMNVADNLGFALKIAKVKKSEIKTRVAEAAKILDLEDYLDRKPGQLSGGQRQRVAMGRAIVRQPRVFLMDEPLSNLDAKLRVATRSQIAALQRRLGVTTVYVTHDQVEAMTMGDRVAVMKDGVLQQVDVPSVLYDSPVNAFVAGFIGSPAMNLLDGTVGADGVAIGSMVVPIPRALRKAAPTGKVTVGLRPESVELAGDGAGIPAVVNLVEELGAEAYIYAQLAHTADATAFTAAPDFILRVDPKSAPQSGTKIGIHVKDDLMLLFDAQSGERITVA
ncbi:MAG: sn-glycerol-3-phosphate ABC transporter ATP-binding protein UgpC [Solirubrobacteraceae bacterium]|jgi:multiple sugar transport system ATP-binding protein